MHVLGLSLTAQSVYAALLEQPQAVLADLVDAAGRPEPEVRDALDELAGLTFVRPSREEPGRLRAVSPQVALDLIVRRQEADLARRSHELAESRAAVAEVAAVYGGTGPGGAAAETERLIGIDAIAAKLEILAKDVEQECLSVMPGGAQSQTSLDASRSLDADAMQRGVSLLTLYHDSIRSAPATYDYAKWLTEQGGEVRTARLLPPRLLIFDRRIAVVPIDPDDTRAGALCTHEPGIVASLVVLFQLSWAGATPFGTGQRPSPDLGVSPAERETLLLLAQGLTDEAAAKRLGIGHRTVARQMANIMERLGASSRFEAGLKAAQRGWI